MADINEIFDKYITNQLTDVEKKEFEALLNTDVNVAFEFKVYKEALDQIKLYGAKKKMASIVKNNQTEVLNDRSAHSAKEENKITKHSSPSKLTLLQNKYIQAAAVFIGLIGSIFIYRHYSSQNSNQVFAVEQLNLLNHFQDDIIELESEGFVKTDQNMEKIWQLFVEKKYKEVLLESNTTDGNDSLTAFILAQSHYKLHQYEKAKGYYKIMDRVIQGKEAKDKCKLMMAICLYMYDEKGGKIMLQEISKSQSSQREKATQLMQELK